MEGLAAAAPLALADLPPPPDATKMPDGSYRCMHPGGGPWLIVEQRGPNVALSTSYSNGRFLRNSMDMFDLALSVASGLGANVVEEVRGQVVTKENVDALLSVDGPYVATQASTFRATQERLQAEGMAPLEYPLGPVDLVSEYFALHVGDGATAERVGSALRDALGKRLTVVSSTTFLVAPIDDRGWLARTFGGAAEPAAKVLVRPDGSVQVWPSWRRPFAECAKVTLEVALLLGRALGAPVMLGTDRCDDAFVATLTPHIGGLGVDFYAWRTARG